LKNILYDFLNISAERRTQSAKRKIQITNHKKQITKNNEQRTTNNEQKTTNKKQQTKNKKQRTISFLLQSALKNLRPDRAQVLFRASGNHPQCSDFQYLTLIINH